MMTPILPALSEILCHPETGRSVRFENDHFETADGARFPVMDGIAVFKSHQPPLRHRIWEWVYNLSAFSYDFGVRYAWRIPFGGAPVDRSSYLDSLSIDPDARFLETAVGTGDNLLKLPACKLAVGMDQSFGMLQRCRRKLSENGRTAGLVQADMAQLPFLDSVFDAVLHVGGLQFMANPAVGIREMHRVAAEGAEVVIVDETASLKSILHRSGADRAENLVPTGGRAVRLETISGGELFYLKFIKD